MVLAGSSTSIHGKRRESIQEECSNIICRILQHVLLRRRMLRRGWQTTCNYERASAASERVLTHKPLSRKLIFPAPGGNTYIPAFLERTRSLAALARSPSFIAYEPSAWLFWSRVNTIQIIFKHSKPTASTLKYKTRCIKVI